MKVHLKILSVFVVLTGVLMKSGNVYEGTVGETVEIRCPYRDDYKYTPKYFCRHPCKSDRVLIKSAKSDQVVSNGRYSLIDIVSGLFFTVTIKHLRLTDSGVYHCGIDQWFSDTLNKVHLFVRPAAPVSRSTHTPENTQKTYTWTTTLTSTVFLSVSLSDESDSYEQFSPTSSTVQSKGSTPLDKNSVSIPVVCAGVLVLLVFGVLVALASLCRKRSDLKSRCLKPPVPENPVQDSPDLNWVSQTVHVDDVHHLYDEIVTEYSLAGPARDGNSFIICSTVQHCDPAPQNDMNALYSLITHH
ncbi:CMRF35-like molecule 3 [Sinocyclocheilus anshuiensis]|uniref:CMRF35-like molecule 3 n=1 Tax=Sinocyclocheilus anshuiensis TaxID=1608454 RepID=UPI0007B87543|nr:PREDICTED: CMRF35-like molecule 3 [Sinocyclocheilus anshuiensis]